MKKIIIVALFALLPGLVKAQSDHFKVDEHKLIWQQVFTTEQSKDALLNYFKSVADISNIQETPTGISFKISSGSPIDIQKYGFKRGKVAAYIVLNVLEAQGLVDFKDGRYRATVRNMVLISNDASAERTGIEFHTVSKKGEIKSIFYSMNAVGPLESYFTDLFTVKIKNDSEW